MSSYLRVPLEAEPSEVVAGMVADMQSRVPGWLPIEGATDTAIIEVQGFQNAIILGQASGTLDSIYRYAGATLFGVAPLDATFAVADSTWTLTAAATALGATIFAGSEVKVQVTATESVGFIVVQDVVIAPGAGVSGVGEVPLVALVAGADGSGLTGDVDKVTPLDAVSFVTLDGVSQGGRDAEEDEDYLDRLTRRLRRLSFSVIHPDEVAELARDVDGIARALVIDDYQAGTNEMQDVTVTGASGGTLPLTYSGQTVTGISATASAAAVELALESLSNIQVGDVECTLGPLGTQPVRVEFKGLLAATNVAAMTTSSASLTGGGTAAVTTSRAGVASVPNTAGSLTVIPIDIDGQPVSSQVTAALQAELEASRQRGFRFYVLPPTYQTIDLTFDFTVYPGSDPVVVKAAAEAAGTAALSPANHGLMPSGDVLLWIDEPKVYYSEIYAALNAVDGLHTAQNVRLSTLLNTDITLPSPGGLPLPGTVVGTAM